jgi:hypothetical protein
MHEDIEPCQNLGWNILLYIIRLEDGDKEEVSETDCSTSLIFETILIEKDKTFFAELTVEKLKESIIKR